MADGWPLRSPTHRAVWPLDGLGTWLLLAVFLPAAAILGAGPVWASAAASTDTAITDSASNGMELPDAPLPQNPAQQNKPAKGQEARPEADPCEAKNAGKAMVTKAAGAATAAAGLPAPAASERPKGTEESPCSPYSNLVKALPIVKNLPLVNWYARFLDGPQVKPMTPKEKAWLAVRNVGDPFSLITILGSSAIAVGSDAHSAYGPGFHGFERYVGVSLTQDMTGEFFGTFLIPSVMHQDPHYHRMPTASMKKRIAHCLYQVVWTQGDNGRGMLNYANLMGFAIDDEIGNLYIPGRETDMPASAERYGTGFALAPIDNFVTEFLPDVARKIHVRIVLIQQIINQVANVKDNGGS